MAIKKLNKIIVVIYLLSTLGMSPIAIAQSKKTPSKVSSSIRDSLDTLDKEIENTSSPTETTLQSLDSQSLDNESLMAIPTSINGENTFEEALPEYVVIEPSERATFSSETSASVLSMPVKEGSMFKKGDVLIKLDCRIQNAELKKAKALQREATIAYKSAQKLKGYGSISEFELIQAVTQRDLADAEVDKLESIVSKCIVSAPFNGSVSKVSVNLYESVKPGDPLLSVVNTDKLDFIVQIPSAWLEWLHVGSIFTVDISELGQIVDVKIAKITPVINSVSQTVKIIGEQVDKKQGLALLPGMSGRASFPTRPSDPDLGKKKL